MKRKYSTRPTQAELRRLALGRRQPLSVSQPPERAVRSTDESTGLGVGDDSDLAFLGSVVDDEAGPIEASDTNELTRKLIERFEANDDAEASEDVNMEAEFGELVDLDDASSSAQRLAFIIEESTIAEMIQPTTLFGDDDEDSSEAQTSTVSMDQPPRRPSLADSSTLVEFQHSKKPTTSLEFTLGVFAQQFSIPQAQFRALAQLIKQPWAAEDLAALPENVATLKQRIFSQLPLIPLRKINIPVLSVKQPTLSTGERDISNTATKDMFFFDVTTMVQHLLQSRVFQDKHHFGMTYFVDEPTQLWHSRAWGSSIRASSGQFAYCKGEPIFPSDVVFYRCNDPTCALYCHTADTQDGHLGRVLQFGEDHRSNAPIQGAVVLILQKLLRREELSSAVLHKCLDFQPNEILVQEKHDIWVPPQHVIRRLRKDMDYVLDYKYGLPSALGVSPIYVDDKLIIRRVVNELDDQVRPLNLTHPIRGELELNKYGRSTLVTLFKDADNCLSLPFLLFIDDFGLYRNMYRSLTGLYWIPAGLTSSERSHRQNVYPLTLGPHGSDNEHVINALRPALEELDAGTTLSINGHNKTVIAFTMAFLGDMPQQEKNGGFSGHAANYGCRFCYIHTSDRESLDFDYHSLGRYHFQHQAIRSYMDTKLNTKTKKIEFGRKYGLNERGAPLTSIAPCLDIIISKPSDPAHSEFKGIGNASHRLLIDHILTPDGQSAYLAQLQHFQFPPGWNRLQSPLKHLTSYTLSENARATIIIPLLLRVWLERKWIQAQYLAAVPNIFQYQSISPVNHIVSAFGDIAKCTSVLSSTKICAADRAQLTNIIFQGRRSFQLLHEAAIVAVNANPRTRGVDPSPSRRGRAPTKSPTPDISPASSRASSVESATSGKQTKKGKELKAIIGKPNVHIGLHYVDQMEEFAVPNNCNVLAGEDKHKYYKEKVLHTNHKVVEKALLLTESVQRSLQLVVDGAFEISHPELTLAVQQLLKQTPAIFSRILQPAPDINDRLMDDEDEMTVFASMAHCEAISVRDQMPATYVTSVLQQSVRLHTLAVTHPLVNELRAAYDSEFPTSSWSEPGSGSLQWCCKVLYTDARSSARVVLQANDFVYFRGDQVGRIQFILVHKLRDQKRVFIRLDTAVPILNTTHSQARDSVLRLPLWTFTGQTVIVGLPAVQDTRLYMLPVTYGETDDFGIREMRRATDACDAILRCTWEVRFV